MSGFDVIYRPGTLDEVWGNETVIDILKGYFDKPNHPHTFLFSGEAGCGKTTIARACGHYLDVGEVVEVNIAKQRNIDDARSLLDGLEFPPVAGKRLYILDECHMANGFWSNSMLKALEEPPEWAYFCLCTTEPKKIIKTIRKRCEPFEMELLPNRVVKYNLIQLINRVGLDDIHEEHLDMVVEAGDGIPRDTLKALERMYQTPLEQRDSLFKKDVENEISEKLGNALLKKNLQLALNIIEQEKGRGEESLRRAVTGYMASVFKRSTDPNTLGRAYNIFTAFKEPFYTNGWNGLIFACVDAIHGG